MLKKNNVSYFMRFALRRGNNSLTKSIALPFIHIFYKSEHLASLLESVKPSFECELLFKFLICPKSGLN